MKKNKFFWAIIGASLGVGALTASAIGYPMDSDRSLPLHIGENGPTRIMIVGEKITDVFVYPKEKVSVTLHASGQIFVLPPEEENDSLELETKASGSLKGRGDKEKLFLTIMGQDGSVQDLSLDFVKGTSEVIRLLKKGENNE